MIRRLVSSALAVLAACTLLAATVPKALLVAQDNHERPLEGFRFAHEGRATLPTVNTGATELELPPPGKEPGEKIQLLLLSAPKDDPDWILVTRSLNVPKPETSADVVLIRRSEFRKLGDQSRHIISTMMGSSRQVLLAVAHEYGLSPEQLEPAIISFGETPDPRDRQLAAFLSRELNRPGADSGGDSIDPPRSSDEPDGKVRLQGAAASDPIPPEP